MSESVVSKTPGQNAGLSAEELDAMEARCEAATPGPWKVVQKGNTVKSMAIKGVCSGMSALRDDYNFIAHARTDLPRLLSAYRALAEKCEAQEDEIGKLQMTVNLLMARLETGKPVVMTAPSDAGAGKGAGE